LRDLCAVKQFAHLSGTKKVKQRRFPEPQHARAFQPVTTRGGLQSVQLIPSRSAAVPAPPLNQVYYIHKYISHKGHEWDAGWHLARHCREPTLPAIPRATVLCVTWTEGAGANACTHYTDAKAGVTLAVISDVTLAVIEARNYFIDVTLVVFTDVTHVLI
jgi:hypothetical protein